VGGDFDVEPTAAEYDRLTDALTDARVAAEQTTGTPETDSAREPRERIDCIFLQGEWTVHETATEGTPAESDHRAVAAELDGESLS